MVDRKVVKAIRRYLEVLNEHGIKAEKAILFGSHARGEARKDSDIDILVLAKEFDKNRWKKDSLMWRLVRKADITIQPIPCGVKQFIEDDGSTIIEVARREGIEITRN